MRILLVQGQNRIECSAEERVPMGLQALKYEEVQAEINPFSSG